MAVCREICEGVMGEAVDQGAVAVFRRRVFYIPGYDPIPPRRYRELYRKEGTDQARRYSGLDLPGLRRKHAQQRCGSRAAGRCASSGRGWSGIVWCRHRYDARSGQGAMGREGPTQALWGTRVARARAHP